MWKSSERKRKSIAWKNICFLPTEMILLDLNSKKERKDADKADIYKTGKHIICKATICDRFLLNIRI